MTFEATGDFPFTFFIEKAIAKDEGEDMIIEGVASTTNIDHDNERMAPEALTSMAEIINEKSVPLRVEHSKSENAIVGSVFKAWVDERNQMWIKARLDKSHPASSILYKSLKDGVKLGLSVGGRVKHAIKELAESAGKMVKTFYQVVLDEVSVTQHPANYDAYLIRKSILKEDAEAFEEGLQKDFLFETRANDYMFSFAKSIPERVWKKVQLKEYNSNVMKKNNENENDEEKKDKSVEDGNGTQDAKVLNQDEGAPEEDANKSDQAFKSMVMKGFESLTTLVGKLISKNEGEDEEKEKSEDDDKKDDAEKSEDDKEDEADKSSKKSEDDEDKEKSEGDVEDEEKGEDSSEYKMKNLLGRMDKMAKAMDDEDKEEEKSSKKSEDDDEKEEKAEKSIDDFVKSLETSVNALEARMEKSGHRVPGLHSQIVQMLQTNPEFQKSIKDLMETPGPKRSVSMGVPFMKSKDGKMFQLTPIGVESKVEKSKKTEGMSFKDLYKSEYSSVAEAGAQGNG